MVSINTWFSQDANLNSAYVAMMTMEFYYCTESNNGIFNFKLLHSSNVRFHKEFKVYLEELF